MLVVLLDGIAKQLDADGMHFCFSIHRLWQDLLAIPDGNGIVVGGFGVEYPNSDAVDVALGCRIGWILVIRYPCALG